VKSDNEYDSQSPESINIMPVIARNAIWARCGRHLSTLQLSNLFLAGRIENVDFLKDRMISNVLI
jgi:hypothetical protein